MSDIYEFFLTVDLRDELLETEIAELRWHLGLGPQPEQPTILPGAPVQAEGAGGEGFPDDGPSPLLAQRGAPFTLGGALFSELVRRGDQHVWGAGWSLTTRQELHPDQFDEVGVLLGWMAARAQEVPHFVGYTRFCEDDQPSLLTLRDARINWPPE